MAPEHSAKQRAIAKTGKPSALGKKNERTQAPTFDIAGRVGAVDRANTKVGY